MPEPRSSYYFLHIPKTAGTTFTHSILRGGFPDAEFCPAYSYRQLLGIPAAERNRYRLFCGHFYYPLYRLLPGRPLTMTFLRDPVERVISLYEFVLRDSTHYQHDLVRGLKGGIREFVHTPELLVPNFQITALAADVDVEPVVARARRQAGGDVDEDRAVLDEMIRRPVSREDLRLACSRLEEFWFVGLTELFEESIEELCAAFGWPAASGYMSLNVAPDRAERRAYITDDLRKEILATHELEMELYEYARALFGKRRARRPASAGFAESGLPGRRLVPAE